MTTTVATLTTINSLKRQQTEETATMTTKSLNPFNEAKNRLEIAKTSLPVEIRTADSKEILDLITSLHEWSQKQATLLSLGDEKVNPKSTKSKFELQTLDKVKDAPKIMKFKEECNTIQEKCAQELKEKIKMSNKIE